MSSLQRWQPTSASAPTPDRCGRRSRQHRSRTPPLRVRPVPGRRRTHSRSPDQTESHEPPTEPATASVTGEDPSHRATHISGFDQAVAPAHRGTYASGDTLGNARAAIIGEAIVVRNRGRMKRLRSPPLRATSNRRFRAPIAARTSAGSSGHPNRQGPRCVAWPCRVSSSTVRAADG